MKVIAHILLCLAVIFTSVVNIRQSTQIKDLSERIYQLEIKK